LETRRALFRRLGSAAVAGLLSLPALRPSAAGHAPAASEPELDVIDGWVLRADDRPSPRDGIAR
jgi:hypothetical protein